MAEPRPAFLARKPGLRWLICGLLGLVGLAAILAGFIVTQGRQDLRPILLVGDVAFFLASLVAPFGGRRADPMGMAVLFVLPAALMALMSLKRIAFTDHLQFALILGAMAMGLLMAAAVRSQDRWVPALGLAACGLAIAGVAANFLAPWVLDQRAFVDQTRTVAPFSFHNLDDGTAVTAADLKGKVVVLSYWATWCTPCLAEMPQIAALRRRYATDPRVRIIPINANDSGDNADKARVFLQRHGFDPQSAIDDVPSPGRSKGQAGVNLGLKVVPTLYVLDPDGQVTATHVGYDASEHLVPALAARIDKLLAAPKS
ncbi:TlpA disulfide reductase family protein [Phenylobacterium sp.]|jgi:thiol-disulfide isomerase/thioredoxin|uniref:TlpA family protein disulfide reductase n=1 Tax=Phenylobacterium sp. TaxID=1871053 RepID=UPI002F40D8F9